MLAVLVAALLPLLVVPTGPAAAAVSCPDIQIFGVRGSGESQKAFYGFGYTGLAIVQTQTKGAHGSSYRARSIVYPAVQTDSRAKYRSSVEAGKVALTTTVHKFLYGGCRRSKILLVGASQGAHVVADTFQARLPAAERAHVIGVVLLGDPRFNGADLAPPDFGDYDPSLSGSYGQGGPVRTWKPEQAPLVRSYCAAGDPICGYTVASSDACLQAGAACPHLTYLTNTYQGKTYKTWAQEFMDAQSAPYLGS